MTCMIGLMQNTVIRSGWGGGSVGVGGGGGGGGIEKG